jgi:hypothetical protein
MGVRPEVELDTPDGLIYFANLLAAESSEKSFTIKNVSLFPVKFNFSKRALGVSNHSGLAAFTYIPSEGTIQAKQSLTVKIIFAPDHPSNHYYEVVSIHILKIDPY